MATNVWEASQALASQGPILPLYRAENGSCDCGQACASPGKHPRTKRGLHEATSDPAVIAYWAQIYPVSNLGLRTDGLVVVDLDGEEGFESLARLESKLGRLPRTRVQRSRPYHEHRLFKQPPGGTLTSSTVGLGNPEGLDLRAGPGAYIVASPSLHPSGRRYESDDYPILDLPLEWVAVLRKRREPRQRHELRVQDLLFGQDTAYGRAALLGETEKLVSARLGHRHAQLNASAFRLGQLVPHYLSVQTVATQLPQVAVLAHDFDLRECSRIVNGGMAAGMQYPRKPR